MHGSRSKISSKKSRPYIHYVKFLALLGGPYIYDISRLRVKALSAIPCRYNLRINKIKIQTELNKIDITFYVQIKKFYL
jgi:hypothetical protein